MGIPSSFPDYNCKRCGILIKKGDLVNKIEATGCWCSNPKCPEKVNAVSKDVEIDSVKVADDIPISAKLRNFTKQETEKLTAIETQVKLILPGAVDAKIGMFVKEIYRHWKVEEARI